MGRWSAGPLLVIALSAVAIVGTACAGGEDGDAPGATSRSSTTTVPLDLTATVVRETVVSGAYRQGVARSDGGWIFSANDALFRTDDAFVEIAAVGPGIP